MENNQAVSDDKQYQSVVDNTSAGVSENNQNNAWQITTMIIVGVVVLGLLLFGYMYLIRKQGVNIPVKTGTQITETVSPTLPISPTVTTDTQKKETLDNLKEDLNSTDINNIDEDLDSIESEINNL